MSGPSAMRSKARAIRDLRGAGPGPGEKILIQHGQVFINDQRHYGAYDIASLQAAVDEA